MMAASRGPSAPLRGSPLPQGRTAGWLAFAPSPQPSRSRVNAAGRLCSGGEASGESREAGGAGGAQAAFVRFWMAGRGDSWSALAFGAKWIISGDGNEFDAEGRLASQMHIYGTICNLCIG